MCTDKNFNASLHLKHLETLKQRYITHKDFKISNIQLIVKPQHINQSLTIISKDKNQIRLPNLQIHLIPANSNY